MKRSSRDWFSRHAQSKFVRKIDQSIGGLSSPLQRLGQLADAATDRVSRARHQTLAGILLTLSGHVATVSSQLLELATGFGIGDVATEYLEWYRLFSIIAGGTTTAFGAWRGFQWIDISTEDRADLRVMEEQLMRAGKRLPREDVVAQSGGGSER